MDSSSETGKQAKPKRKKRDPKIIYSQEHGILQLRVGKKIGDSWHISLPKLWVEFLVADDDQIWFSLEPLDPKDGSGWIIRPVTPEYIASLAKYRSVG